MDIAAFHPPDYGLIDTDPLAFRQQFQAFLDALTAYQSQSGDLERMNAELHAALDGANAQLQQAEQLAQEHRAAAETAIEQHNLAVAAYRQAVLDGDPSVPPALVQGQTVTEVDASLEKARGVVQFIRDKLATRGGAGDPGATAPPQAPAVQQPTPPRVPAGAPGRTLPDLSALSAREKLIYGTQRSQ